MPAGQLLLTGADDRVIPHDGTNAYGFPTFDTSPVALLSSCTASPPGVSDLATVDEWRQHHLDTIAATHRSLSPAEWRTPIAAGILDVLGLPPEDARRLILTPSGTDTETLAAAIAVYSHGRPLVNIVVGARETGSGTLRAAAGLSTTTSTPLAPGSAVGEPIDGLGPDLIRVVDVDVRDARGRARRTFDVEAEIEAHVEAALHDGATVLVHALECSKTGLTYLDPDWVRTWRARHPGALRVIVDAAQGRTAEVRLRAFLAAGASVVITGSKAMSGAPFCGVLVLDDAMLADAAGCDRLPAGLGALLSIADLPPELAGLGVGWEPVNLGLLARWHTALEAHRRYVAIPAPDRQRWSAEIVAGLRSALGGIPSVEVLAETHPTMVSFTVSGAAGPLGREPLTQLHRAIAAQHVYLGQPAELVGGGTAVLRAAVGYATLNAAASAPQPSAYLQQVVTATVTAVRDALHSRSATSAT